MPNPLHSFQYDVFRRLLVRARLDAGLTQVAVADKLRKPQSFISKVERGERRLDVPEFIQMADAIGIDVPMFVDDFRQELNQPR